MSIQKTIILCCILLSSQAPLQAGYLEYFFGYIKKWVNSENVNIGIKNITMTGNESIKIQGSNVTISQNKLFCNKKGFSCS